MLTTALQSYLELRRAMGFALHADAFRLRSFVRFATARGDTHVRAETVTEWAREARTAGERARRLHAVRLWARHLRAENPRHQMPAADQFGRYRPQRRRPFLFSSADLARLLDATRQMGPPTARRPHTFAALFALLACTGMRVSEARRLTMRDLTPDGLLIQKTKFKKTRLVPLHLTATAALVRYRRRWRRDAGADDPLFVSTRGGPLALRTVEAVFQSLVKRLDLYRGRARGPRIHDLRHTFAVRALETCPDSRDHVAEHMLALTTYLGHSHVAYTYWYLQATPHLMADVADRAEKLVFGGAL